MKQHLNILVTVSLLLCALCAEAQKESKSWSLGFLSEAGLPKGDARSTFSIESGISVRLSIHAGPGFITLSGGAVLYAPKVSFNNLLADSSFSDSSFDLSKLRIGVLIPVKIGYKFIFAHHFFIMGEAGYSRVLYYYFDANDNTHSIHSGGLTYAPSLGFQFKALEIGIKYESVNATQGTGLPFGHTISSIGTRIGFNF